MNAGYFHGEPGARPYDSEWDEQRVPDPTPESCFDCEALVSVGGIGAAGRVYCQNCGRAREVAGILFDQRPLSQIDGQEDRIEMSRRLRMPVTA